MRPLLWKGAVHVTCRGKTARTLCHIYNIIFIHICIGISATAALRMAKLAFLIYSMSYLPLSDISEAMIIKNNRLLTSVLPSSIFQQSSDLNVWGSPIAAQRENFVISFGCFYFFKGSFDRNPCSYTKRIRIVIYPEEFTDLRGL